MKVYCTGNSLTPFAKYTTIFLHGDPWRPKERHPDRGQLRLGWLHLGCVISVVQWDPFSFFGGCPTKNGVAQKGFHFSPTAESSGVSAQIGSGEVRGGPAVRFHEGSTRVPSGFHQGSMRFCEGCGVVRAVKRAPHAVGDIT